MNEEKKLGTVYGLICTENNKIYVGVTTKTIDERYDEHMYVSQEENNRAYNFPVYVDIRKYGGDKFKPFRFELFTYNDESELYDHENFWIRNLHTKDPEIGYNQHGGNMFSRNTPEYRKQYHEEHRGEENAGSAKWHSEHPDEVRAIKVKWAKNNPDKKRASSLKYYYAHRDEINRKRREQRAAKKTKEVRV